MKQKITIGLLVFFLGILITACGKKNNNGGGSNPGPGPINFGDIRIPENCNGRCEQVEQATFYIENKDEYANVFIGDIGQLPGQYAGRDVPSIADPNFDIAIMDIFLGNFLNPVVNCGGVILAGKFLRRLSGSEVRARCTYTGQNRDMYDNLRDSYRVNVQFNFDNRAGGNGIYSVIIDIDTEGRRTIVEFDRRQNDHLFRDRNGNTLEINRDTINIASSSGRQVGYIRN